MRPLPPAAALQRGAFTVAQARDAGWTRSALRHAVASDELVVVRKGVLAVPPAPSGRAWLDAINQHVLAGAAAVLSRPHGLASHCSAALLLDLPVLKVPTRPCLTVPRRHTGSIPGVHLHRAVLHRGDPGRLGYLRMTMPARTVIDIARECGEIAAVVTADGALRRGVLTRDALEFAVAATAGRGGAVAARVVLGLADPRSESALESRSRLAMRAHGLPVPQLQTSIFVSGAFVGRVDFYWDEFGVVGEADGWEKYRPGWEQVRAEKVRQERLERAGLIVVRWSSDDLRDFGVVAARLRDAFARGALRARSERAWTTRMQPS